VSRFLGAVQIYEEVFMMPANKQHRVRKALEDKQKEELIALPE